MEKNKHAEDGGSKWKYGLRWDEKYETGHDTIDAQHKELFRLTSDVIEACEHGLGLEVVSKALDFLTSYTASHFADEETLMTQNYYPTYEEHKKIHEDFKQTVTQIVGRYRESGSTLELSHEVNGIIVRWLIMHISQVDRKFADYVKLIESKLQRD